MLDQNDLKVLRELISDEVGKAVTASEERMTQRIDQAVTASEERMTQRIDQAVTASEERMTQRIDQAFTASEERMIQRIDASEERMNAKLQLLIENYFDPKFRLLAEGHETLRQTLAPKDRVDALAEEVDFLKTVVASMHREINELKKAI